MVFMKISHLACVLLLLTTSAYAQTTSLKKPWKFYTLKGEDLSVALPASPALHTDMNGGEIDGKPRPQRVLGSYADGIVYTIFSIDNGSARESLEAFIKERFRKWPAQYSSAADPMVDGASGKAFSINFNDGTNDGMTQFFSTNDRLYELRVSGAPSDDPRVTIFFSTLSFKKNEKAIEVTGGAVSFSGTAHPQIASDPTAETVFTGKEIDTKPRLLSKPEPQYTQKARDAGVMGLVVLKCVFSATGEVTNIRVILALPKGLTEQAVEAAKKIKFVPAMKGGKNVSMWMQLEYNFSL